MRARPSLCLLLAALPGCRLGTSLTETEWRPQLQARTQRVSIDARSAALDPWSDRYVIEFGPERGSPSASPCLVLEIERTIPDGKNLDAQAYLKSWRYDSAGRESLTPKNSRLKAGKLGFERRPEERLRGSYDLLFVAVEDGKALFGDVPEFQIAGMFRVMLSPPKTR